MQVLTTPLTAMSKKLMLLGSGELGKEVAIEAQRLGVEVVAVDRYAHAPAMQVAHRAHVINMLDAVALRALVEQERPDWIVPEVEAIHTPTLIELEKEGFHVVPTARATRLTMDREGIRRLASEELGLATSRYQFVDTREAFDLAVAEIGLPCVVKPIMSSSGKGQSLVRTAADIEGAWDYAQKGGRAGMGRVIVEAFVPFDYEITLLTVRHRGGTSFCEPIGHFQEDGDYRESWQPQPMSASALADAQAIAAKITDALGGFRVFGVELFVRGDEVLFSEVSPRPHDTGLVTLASQDLSEFALHVRAILGLPIPVIRSRGYSASMAILAHGNGVPIFHGVAEALAEVDTELRLFGKPIVEGHRRVGVALARGDSLFAAREKARRVAERIRIEWQ
ncbi:MAG: formate-dependent phosphoribosylglycinamide formyltransferase [Ahniella sp.]|nr:formate-dependent phosphoribosylglycinamide formyltransferase [Ahniella sp.]